MPDEPWVGSLGADPEQPAPGEPAPDQMASGEMAPDELVAQPSSEPNDSDRPKRRGKVKTRHTVARVLTVTVLLLAMMTGLTVVYWFRHLSGNLTVVNYENELSNRPTKQKVEGPKDPLNILVMGSDTREGQGNAIDQESGGGSDTTILLHLSADRTHAYGVSIPRDSMVDRPACDHGAIPAASYQQWNAAFSIGGAPCTIQQFEQLTGIRVDHYVVVDFNGFQGMVDAIGGVEVCIPETIDDRSHGIYLKAGTREVEGREALAYVRQRYAVGDGSDIGRMKRQQAFIASMANKVVSAGTLTNPQRLLGFLNAATQSLKVDKGLDNVGKIAQLGFEFRHIDLANIQFLTIPWGWDPNDPNRVVWAPEAKQVWQRITRDEPLTRKLTVDAISAAKPHSSKGKKNKNGGVTPSPPRPRRTRPPRALVCAPRGSADD
ncbi:MAG: LCP family protein [Nocardioides sp.]